MTVATTHLKVNSLNFCFNVKLITGFTRYINPQMMFCQGHWVIKFFFFWNLVHQG